MLAGLRTLIQTRHGPDRYVPLTLFDAMPSVREHDRAVLGDMFVEQNDSECERLHRRRAFCINIMQAFDQCPAIQVAGKSQLALQSTSDRHLNRIINRLDKREVFVGTGLAGPPGRPAARIGDPVAHPSPEVLTPGLGSPNVFIGKKPAWRGVGGAQGGQLQKDKSASDNVIQKAELANKASGGALQTELDDIKDEQQKEMSAKIMALAGVDKHICATLVPPPIPHGPGVITDGSKTVMINGMPACRQGDTVTEAIGPPNKVLEGLPTVLIGG
jgi:uncharacterized Zn-binding protein involved in type VI secretion